jgi:hypothetical protein
MNEEEKAQKLSDAIDALLEGRVPDVDDPELRELLGIARLRLRAGKALADVGLTYQELLRRVLQARMVSRQIEQKEETEDPPPEAHDITEIVDPREYLDPLDPGYGKLVNFLDFWPRAGHMRPSPGGGLPGAKSGATATKPAGPSVVIPLWQATEQRKTTRADALAPVVDRLVRGRKRTSPTDDHELEELVQVAHLRRCVGQALAAAGTPYKRRLWSVLRLRLAAALRRQAAVPPQRTIAAAVGRSPWKYGVAAAAAIALTLLALGPWAATGFADHPITEVFDFVTGHVGVQGVDGPPPTQVPTYTDGTSVSPEEAGARLGLSLREPTYLPEGFKLASSVYYAKGVTSPEQGTFVQAYTQGGVNPDTLRGQTDPRITVYQERATSNTIAEKSAYIEQVVIGGSLPGTYVRGIWTAGLDGTLEWVEGDAEVLAFDQNDVRTFIVYRYGEQVKEELLKIAESMLAQ